MAKNKKTRKVTVKKKQTAKRNQGMHRVPRANRKYKDTVFRMLFSDKENLLSLYNAINRSVYENPEDLEIVTLENAIYMGMKNDLAFIIDTNLFLYEHQSTYNPNMPLRGVFYFSRLYEGYVADNNLMIYHEKRVRLPKPKYIVFYNGTKAEPDRQILKLSDSFPDDGIQSHLEVMVVALNINYGHNRELMEKCRKILEEY